MLKYICESLKFFRKSFPRNTTWILFCLIVLGFIGTTEMVGVTSFCRFWGVGKIVYKALLHFFRTPSWSLAFLLSQWGAFVLSQGVTIYSDGRAVLIGDHTYVPKDGRRMPGVVSLHQHSETQSKPSYFRGHCWGCLALAVGSMSGPYCLPLALGIHLGMLHLGHVQESRIERKSDTMGTRIVEMALDFAIRNDTPSILVLDAFFPTGYVFRLAASVWFIATKEPALTLIIRGKKNCVAYFEAEQPTDKKPGRPPIYGLKIKVMELFDHPEYFTKTTARIYGKKEEILIGCLNLLWKPTGGLIRFVLTVTSRGTMFLMCSNPGQEPLAAVELYCLRPRIEVMFDMLKNLLGVFAYRFWSRKMPRHSRKPLKNKLLKPVPIQNLKTVKRCWESIERFVMLGVIAHGLLILTGLKFTDTVWENFHAYLRTKSRNIPSERTVKYVVTPLIVKNFSSSASITILREIWNYCFMKNFRPNKLSSHSQRNKRVA